VAWHDTEGATHWLAGRLAAAPEATPARAPAPVVADPEADRRFTAREHVEEGWDAPPPRREALARAALDAWPDCADAWRLLASVAADPAEEVERLREAVRAGERALGRAPGSGAGPLPESEDARAYLRARAALAAALRRRGDEEAALAQERRALEEDPDDPLGLGVPHVARLLALGRDAEAAEALARREEDVSPGWAWARVLARRRCGDSVGASFALADATLSAPLVAPMLLGEPPRGDDMPETADAWIQARSAADALRPAWRATPGALEWLRERLPPLRPDSRSRPPRRR
jgi:tetratricopeptide (TPR) repeat protein